MVRNKQEIMFMALLLSLFLVVPHMALAGDVKLYFPPDWKSKASQAKAISEALSQDSGIQIKPRIASSYPEIIDVFSKDEPVLVYVGSFVQAVLYERGLSVPIVQGKNGKEFYTSVLVAPESAGSDPVSIVKSAGPLVAYCKGASSGESGAKAATGGKANVPTNNHTASVNAVKAGKAKAAFVKNWWWESNKGGFNGMVAFEYPGVSSLKNPDNVLSANKSLSADLVNRIKSAAIKNANVFGVDEFNGMDPELLAPSLALMKMGKIDPKAYTW